MRLRQKLACAKGQSIIEFAVVLPLLVIITLGVVEVSYALLDQHVITKLTREGSNLISRDTTIQEAEAVMKTMSTAPVDFNNGSRLIFSVIKKGATTGTANFDRLILYQRREFGAIPGVSAIKTVGAGSFSGGPNYEAVNSDSNTNLRLTNMQNLVVVRGGMIYVTEIFTQHDPITPFERFGINMPKRLYSIAYF